MRIARRLAHVALVSAGALLLTGCMPTDPEVVPPPESSSTPIFASDEEALEAATEAYEAYLAMSDLIAQEGGKNPERLAPFVSPDVLSDQVGQFAPYQEKSLHSSGWSAFDSIAIQQFTETGRGVAEIVIYLCLDVTNVRVIDAAGTDVTPSERDSRLPLEIGFEGRSDAEQLLIVQSESWRGADFC